MPCILLLLALAFPRVILAAMFFLSNYLEKAYHGILIPLLGFFFLPITTIVYAWLVNNGYAMNGLNLIWILIAVMIDLGSLGGGGYSRRRR